MGESNRLKLASKPKPEQFFTISGRDKLLESTGYVVFRDGLTFAEYLDEDDGSIYLTRCKLRYATE